MAAITTDSFLTLEIVRYSVQGSTPVIYANIIHCTIEYEGTDSAMVVQPISLNKPDNPVAFGIPPGLWSKDMRTPFDLSPKSALELLLGLLNSTWKAVPPAPSAAEESWTNVPPMLRDQFAEFMDEQERSERPPPLGTPQGDGGAPIDLGDGTDMTGDGM